MSGQVFYVRATPAALIFKNTNPIMSLTFLKHGNNSPLLSESNSGVLL